MLLISLISACTPLISPSIPTSPTPLPTDVPPIVGIAVVQSVEVQIMESSPLQANAVIRGQLPDGGCTTIASADQTRDGNTFRLTLTTITDPLALCAMALTPFEQVIALDVSDLQPAKYTVNANGIERSFEMLTRNVWTFNQQLVDGLNARNYDLLRVMMDDSFMLVSWRSQGTTYQVEPAIQQLQTNFLDSNTIIVADPSKNLIELLGGVDPVSILGPDLGPVSPLFISGLGVDGKDEAVLYVGTLSDGSLYWHGLLFAKGGFAQTIPVTGPNQPVDTNTYSTNVSYIVAQRDVALYNGPANNLVIVGVLYGGQIARVTGTNINGSWWRVDCPDGTPGSCWVSADPGLTQTTTAPHNNQPPPKTDAVPTISILSVVRDESVTIQARNYPADTKFNVRMGKIGTSGIDGILVDTINSKNGGTFTITFEIPRKLYGEKQIAIRLESSNGYYSYNWFDNASSGNWSDSTEAQPTNVKKVIALDTIVVREGPGAQYPAIGTIAPGQISKVTGMSKDGDWWRIICPDDMDGSCWVSAKPRNTEPVNGNGNN